MKHKEVLVLTGAGSIGISIVRRIGTGKHIIVADLHLKQATCAVELLANAGFEATATQVDISSRVSILKVIDLALCHGKITSFVNSAGVSPSQATMETILNVDLYGTALLLEEFGKVIEEGGSGLIISSQSGHRLPSLSQEENKQLALTPTEKLLDLTILTKEHIVDNLHAYQLSKRCNVLRVMAQAVEWGKRGARLNSISPGIIITPFASDELQGPRGEQYRNMIEQCPAQRAGTPDEVANVAQLLMGEQGTFITGSDILMDGGSTASYWYGNLEFQ